MKAYITYFKLKFISSLQYRSAAWAGISTQFFFGIIYIMVYIAFYESGGKGIPMSLSQTVTYLWLNQMFLALLNQFTKDEEIYKIIRDGNISYELSRPKKLYFLWYFKILGQRLASVTLRLFPILIITFMLSSPYRMRLPESFVHFFLFILSLGFGTLLVVSITILYPIITLHTLNEKGIVEFLINISGILSGLVVPVPFFPKFLQIISSLLPFQYISDLPFRIYVGNVSITNSIIGILIQGFWIIIMISIGNLLLNKCLKRVVVQGG